MNIIFKAMDLLLGLLNIVAEPHKWAEIFFTDGWSHPPLVIIVRTAALQNSAAAA